VTSGFAASLLSRRYLLGPLIALALVGANQATAPPDAQPLPSTSATPSLTPEAGAQKVILLGHDAEGIYFVDNLVYAAATGGELKVLQGIEPNVVWGIDVIVELPAQEGAQGLVAIIRAPIMGGGSLCMAEVSEVQDAGTYYARVAGTAKCPPHKKGMPGWSEDQATGWATP
jgi:hypothetical protein